MIDKIVHEKQLININKHVGRPFNQDLKTLINCILFVSKTNIPWYCLPKEYGSYITVYKYFNKFSKHGVFKEAYRRLLKFFT